MSAEILMYTFWIRNDATAEATQIKGQGTTVAAAFKDGWDGANEAFRQGSDGDAVAPARLMIQLKDGRKVARKPTNFATRTPWTPEEDNGPNAPICQGDAAKTYATLVEEGKAEWKKKEGK
jgi:hypothetical protein